MPDVQKKSNLDLSIRIATTDDIPLIQKLSLEIWPQTYSSIISREQTDYMLEMMYSNESLISQINKGTQFIIINEKYIPLGFASYKMIGDNIYKLDKIYLLQSQQRKGIGKFVMNHIIEEIKNKGAASLQLQVNRNNINAKSFYEKIGFQVIKEADFEIGNGYFMNDFVMEIKI